MLWLASLYFYMLVLKKEFPLYPLLFLSEFPFMPPNLAQVSSFPEAFPDQYSPLTMDLIILSFIPPYILVQFQAYKSHFNHLFLCSFCDL